ncbi:MAG: ABC transporter ATP-binding protein [Bacteroidia bacterium]|nr:ABC transporter ATP-binding protein [Bacteroidia bacterium]
MEIIETQQLSKVYGQFTAVNQLSLKISRGEIYGFLGLNGAGKTTTMRMLLGMIKPSSGAAFLLGKDVHRETPSWEKVGYMVESTYAYPNLSVEENLKIFASYYNLKDKNAISSIISRLHLDPYRHKKAKQLSLGNLQRLGLARALMHQPEILILDEPVNGLDPSGIVEIRQLLKSLSEQGTTILISSHLLSEIAKIADTIGIIHQGNLVRELKSRELHDQVLRKLVIRTNDNARALAILAQNGLQGTQNPENEIEISDLNGISHPENIAEILVREKIALQQLFTFEEDLESFFLRTIQPEKV